MSGNFEENKPKGNGKMYWKNGDICTGEISGNICKGTMTTKGNRKASGEFKWAFDHENHQFRYNGQFHP